MYHYLGAEPLTETEKKALFTHSLMSMVGGAAAAYHGYKRTKSMGWALGWGLTGFLFPLITNAIALAQGYGDRKK